MNNKKSTVLLEPDLALQMLSDAEREKKITPEASKNLRRWLTEPRYQAAVPAIHQHLLQQQWKALDDAFWTVIPFGTGGRRGRMYPIGCNTINDRTIGESAQGLATYLKRVQPEAGQMSCAIAYDTRHQSRHFAELCASIMVANGLRVYFLDGYRSTPELSFLIREKKCQCGLIITASHNPPSDNAVKVYWSHGGQLVPPHDEGVIQEVMQVDQIETSDFEEAVQSGQVVFCQQEIDQAFAHQHRQASFPGPRNLKILYSPLHGVGEWNVTAALQAAGFSEIEVYQPHREPDGNFTNVPHHTANPENPAVFQEMIRHAQQSGIELILATDPDCDRMGAAAPLTTDPSGPWETLTGNQLGSLLADYVLGRMAQAGQLSPDHYVVKTLVTTDLIRRIANGYGVKTFGDLLVGFKWIAQVIDQQGPDRFVFGTEESHGFLVGQYARDKDGAVACMLMAELAAHCRANGESVHQRLDALYRQHGYHAERLMTLTMEGSDGMRRMEQLMALFRNDPPSQIASIPIAQVRDYQTGQVMLDSNQYQPLAGPKGNLIFLDFSDAGNSIAVRPSGTEPKIKFYMLNYVSPDKITDLSTTKSELDQRLDGVQADLRKLADQV